MFIELFRHETNKKSNNLPTFAVALCLTKYVPLYNYIKIYNNYCTYKILQT